MFERYRKKKREFPRYQQCPGGGGRERELPRCQQQLKGAKLTFSPFIQHEGGKTKTREHNSVLPHGWQELSHFVPLLPPRVCFSRKLASGAEPETDPGSVMWDTGVLMGMLTTGPLIMIVVYSQM